MQSLLKRLRTLSEPVARLYSAEILLALCHLHERNTLYRDLKPENVVLDKDGHALLTDFGLSKEGVNDLVGTKSFCGSWAFMAPEVVRRKGHSRTVDIYGVGVMAYCMLVGVPPYYDRRKEVLLNNIKHMQLRIPTSVPQDAASLIRATMAREPKDRLGAGCSDDVKRHEWFAALDFDALMRREVPVPRVDKDDDATEVGGQEQQGTAWAEGDAAFQRLSNRFQKSRGPTFENWEFASPDQVNPHVQSF